MHNIEKRHAVEFNTEIKYLLKNGFSIFKWQFKKCIDHAKASATDALKTPLKRITLKKVEVTDDLTDNKIAKRNYKKC